MNFFGDQIDVAEIADGPKAGNYQAVIETVEVNKKSKSGGNFIVFHYRIDDPSFDFPVQDWFSFPENLDPRTWDDSDPVDAKGNTEKQINQRSLKWFKRRLIDFGVPADVMNKIGPDQLEGMPITVKVTINDNGYTQVASVSPAEQKSGTSAVTASTPEPVAKATAAPATSTPSASPFGGGGFGG